MKWLAAISLSLFAVFGCQTSQKRDNVSTAKEFGADRFTGFCRPSAGECAQSCASLNQCYGEYNAELCGQRDPQGGEFACMDRNRESRPSGPPGGAEVWLDPTCLPSPQECSQIGCQTGIFVEYDPVTCGEGVPYACYCHK